MAYDKYANRRPILSSFSFSAVRRTAEGGPDRLGGKLKTRGTVADCLRARLFAVLPQLASTLCLINTRRACALPISMISSEFLA
jgi:hypothetical protein